MIVSFLSQFFDSTYLHARKSKVGDWIRSYLKFRIDWIKLDW